MIFQIRNITGENRGAAVSYFENIFQMKDESLVARFFIAKIMEELIARELSDDEKILLKDYETGSRGFVFNKMNVYFSLSHKENIVCIGISDQKLGVDVENMKKRDKSVLTNFNEDEYDCLDTDDRWEGFYRIWTAKESLIKYMGLSLDTMQDIELIKTQEDNREIGDQKFDLRMGLYYDGSNYKVLSGKGENTIYALIGITHEQI